MSIATHSASTVQASDSAHLSNAAIPASVPSMPDPK